jgi:hypothetical protein
VCPAGPRKVKASIKWQRHVEALMKPISNCLTQCSYCQPNVQRICKGLGAIRAACILLVLDSMLHEAIEFHCDAADLTNV